MGFLTDVVERVRKDLERRPLADGSLMLRTSALPPPRDFEAAVRAPGIGIVAEIKRASPSAGAIADLDAGDQAQRYDRGGAIAVSVLTEPRHFDGSLADLRLARRRTELPLLRKDFIVHPSQILESRAEGADAVLLISAALSEAELRELREIGEELGMTAVVEAHSEHDLEKALASGARVVGVNARDLETLEVDVDAALDLARRVPHDRALVVESGISTRADVVRARDAGADAILVGETLVRAKNPETTIRRLLGTLQPARAGDSP